MIQIHLYPRKVFITLVWNYQQSCYLHHFLIIILHVFLCVKFQFNAELKYNCVLLTLYVMLYYNMYIQSSHSNDRECEGFTILIILHFFNQESSNTVILPILTDTTSQHGSHVFDQNCDICLGKKPQEPSPKPIKSVDTSDRYFIVLCMSVFICLSVDQNCVIWVDFEWRRFQKYLL